MPLIESAIGGIAWSIIETAGKAGKYVVNQGKEAYNDVQHKQRVLEASAAYIQHYYNRHCQIKIMPGLMKAPLAACRREEFSSSIEGLSSETLCLENSKR